MSDFEIRGYIFQYDDVQVHIAQQLDMSGSHDVNGIPFETHDYFDELVEANQWSKIRVTHTQSLGRSLTNFTFSKRSTELEPNIEGELAVATYDMHGWMQLVGVASIDPPSVMFRRINHGGDTNLTIEAMSHLATIRSEAAMFEHISPSDFV